MNKIIWLILLMTVINLSCDADKEQKRHFMSEHSQDLHTLPVVYNQKNLLLKSILIMLSRPP